MRATPYREADLVLVLYTAEHGQLSAIAKGVKKPAAKLAGACEPLTLNRLMLARGKSLHTVCHYERMASFNRMRGDLERMAAASVCTDLLWHLGRAHDPESEVVFTLLSQTLEGLDTPQEPWISHSLGFHIHMLGIAGYLPDLEHCVHCQEVLPVETEHYFPFSLLLGGFLCRSCGALTTSSQRVNVSSATIRLMRHPDDTDLYANALKAHRFLAYYWGHRLDRPLKSFDFLFDLLEQQAPAGEGQSLMTFTC